MDSVALMKRVDTKFLVKRNLLESILSVLQKEYQLLEIGGHRLMQYQTTYFDDQQRTFYHDHHNKRAFRYKVRIRNYVETNCSFLEVKKKDNKKNTTKKRIALPSYQKELNHEECAFVNQITMSNQQLEPVLENGFKRMTLVSLKNKERATIDIDLSYNNKLFNEDLVIIELKQEKLTRTSAIFQELKKRGIAPYSISKYCIGMASCYPSLKRNYFKPKLQKINKITA